MAGQRKKTRRAVQRHCSLSTALALLASGLACLVPVAQTALAAPLESSSISAWGTHACAIDQGKAYCWGNNTLGQLGDGNTANSSVPVAVDTSGALAGQRLTQITVGGFQTCALDETGTAYCWGYHGTGDGLLSVESSDYSTVPLEVDASGVLAGKTLTKISGGDFHTCALDSAGAAYCWGDNLYGELGDNTTSDDPQVAPVAVDTSGALAGETLTQISAGQDDTCVLDSAGAAYCWGSGALDGGSGNSSVPVAVNTSGVLAGKTLTQIASTGGTCALDNHGVAYCWGRGYPHGPAVVLANGGLAGKSLAQLSGTCALDSADAAYCWGDNTYGQLGDGNTAEAFGPVAVDTSGALAGKTLTQISGTCVLDSAGAAYCWGENFYGELGDDSSSNLSDVPIQVGPQAPTDVAAAPGDASASVSWTAPVFLNTGVITGYTATATASPGGAECTTSGATTCAITGLTSGLTYSITVVVHTTAGSSAASVPAIVSPEGGAAISAGSSSCAIEGGKAYCWGSNDEGQLGDASSTDSAVPVAVDAGGALADKTLTQITTSDDDSTCALDSAGIAYCWGRNNYGQLGNGGTAGSRVPVAVDAGGALANKTLIEITAGNGQTCALDTGGAAYCWGDNQDGAAGLGDFHGSTSVPRAVDTSGVLAGKILTRISAVGGHVCALDNVGAAYCWGLNAYGELGDGSIGGHSNVPVSVDPGGALAGKTLSHITAGGDHTCALDTTGTAYCWGRNNYGQLGDASISKSSVPVAVHTRGVLHRKVLTQITAGFYNTCALDTVGAAYCWGDNDSGQLGNGTTVDSSVPVTVDNRGVLDDTTVATQVSSGLHHTCAMDITGGAYCWGNNGNGDLGDGTSTSSSVPVVAGPRAPAIVGVVVTGTTADVRWSAPTSLDGGNLQGYTATITPGDATCAATHATNCRITGLTRGTTYRVTVVARTTVGLSDASMAKVFRTELNGP